jgi:circadian clock protein KaiC
MGVTVLLINEMGTIAGDEVKVSEHGISYLADTVVLMRYVERDGALLKTIGTLKKRTGDFEKVVREFQISEDGLHIGAPLRSPDADDPPDAGV